LSVILPWKRATVCSNRQPQQTADGTIFETETTPGETIELRETI
jgi:hypothetical protein